MPEARVRSIAAEVAYLRRRFPDGGRGLEQLIPRACHAWGSAVGHEGAWVKRVVWDASSGCHPDGVGYTMYTVRPYLLDGAATVRPTPTSTYLPRIAAQRWESMSPPRMSGRTRKKCNPRARREPTSAVC